MAPSSSAVHIRLAEPVVFLRNLDSATDRRERRALRRRAQQATEALNRVNDYHPSGAATGTLTNNGPASLFGGHDHTFIPPHGRGGAGGRSRDRSSSMARGSSATRDRSTGNPAIGSSPSQSRSASRNQPADLQRGRSPAPRRDPSSSTTEQQPATAESGIPAEQGGGDSTHQQPDLPPPHNAPPLPLADVPVIHPEDTSIGLTRPPAIIRGVMTINFSKPTRVKKIGIRLKGQSKTEWPEGLGPRRLDTIERTTLIDETVLFFDATSSTAANARRTASVGPGIRQRQPSTPATAATEPTSASAFSASTGRSMSLLPPLRVHQPFQHSSRISNLETAQPSFGVVAPPSAATASQIIPGAPQSTSPEAAAVPITNPLDSAPEYSRDSHLHLDTSEAAMGRMPTPHTSNATSLGLSRPSTANRSASPLSPYHSPQSIPHATSHPPGASTSAAAERATPHEHFQDRAAELRAQAAATSPPQTPHAELSPAHSRSSSLYERHTTTTTALVPGSSDDSRPVSLAASTLDGTEIPAAKVDQLDARIYPSTAVLDNPDANASGISLSSASEADPDADASSLHEERGRSTAPVARSRENRILTNQTIAEDGPQEDYLDRLNNSHSHTASPPRVEDVAATRSTRDANAAQLAQAPGMALSSHEAVAPNNSVYSPTVSRSSSAAPSPSAIRPPSVSTSGRRSSSVASGHTPKSTRFSLKSLIGRDKSSTRHRTASPDGLEAGKRAISNSRSKVGGLQAIKHALALGHDDKDYIKNSVQATHTPISSDAESDSDDEGGRGRRRSASRSTRWQEFKAGTYNFPIYFPIPLSLPPTIHANHGQVTYVLKGFVNRAGALTTNLHTVQEVHVVAAPHEDDLEAIESIIVERMWETQLNYKIVIQCKSAPIGGEIPVSIRLSPLAKMKLFRLTAVLEERYIIYARDRKMSRVENVRRYDLLKIQNEDGSAMLPIISDDPDALAHSPLKNWIPDAGTSDGTGVQTLDPFGPWFLESTIPLPDCSSALQFSTSHEKANISVIHSLKVILRVERGDDEYVDSKGVRKKFDIIVEAPMHILSCRTAQANALPSYSAVPSRVNNPFDTQGEISINSSAFHPHELSDNERHIVHYRGVTALTVTPVGRHSHIRSNHHGSVPPAVSDAQLQEAVLQGGGAGALGPSEPAPPTYEYVRTHPDDGREPPRALSVEVV